MRALSISDVISLQGNAGRSCLLLWNAKNVASPKHGPCHTYNAKRTTKDYKHGCHSTVFKVDYTKNLTSFIHMMLDTVNIGPTDTHTH